MIVTQITILLNTHEFKVNVIYTDFEKVYQQLKKSRITYRVDNK